MQYPIAIQQKNLTFYAYLPDLPDLDIEGNSIADTIARARVLVFKHLQNLVDNGQDLPTGSDISQHLNNPSFSGWTWAIISIDANRIIGETLSIDIKIPERLMQRILSYTEQQQLEINDFFIEAIKKSLPH